RDVARTARIAHEDPVLRFRFARLPVGAGGREVLTEVAAHADLPRAVAAVEPDLVAAAAGAVEKVARGQVLHPDVVGLEDEHAVASERLIAGVERAEVLVCRSGGALRRSR